MKKRYTYDWRGEDFIGPFATPEEALGDGILSVLCPNPNTGQFLTVFEHEENGKKGNAVIQVMAGNFDGKIEMMINLPPFSQADQEEMEHFCDAQDAKEKERHRGEAGIEIVRAETVFAQLRRKDGLDSAPPIE